MRSNLKCEWKSITWGRIIRLWYLRKNILDLLDLASHWYDNMHNTDIYWRWKIVFLFFIFPDWTQPTEYTKEYLFKLNLDVVDGSGTPTNKTSSIVLEFQSAKAVHNIIKVQRFPKELWFVLLFKYIIPISSTNRFPTLSYWCNSYRHIYEVTWVFRKGCILRDRNVAIISWTGKNALIWYTSLDYTPACRHFVHFSSRVESKRK